MKVAIFVQVLSFYKRLEIIKLIKINSKKSFVKCIYYVTTNFYKLYNEIYLC